MESLQFVNPWYLAGGLAALVPLAIYLLQRHRAHRVVFGSVWFLRDLAKKIGVSAAFTVTAETSSRARPRLRRRPKVRTSPLAPFRLRLEPGSKASC